MPSVPTILFFSNDTMPLVDEQSTPNLAPLFLLFFFLIGCFTVYLFRGILVAVNHAWLAQHGFIDPAASQPPPSSSAPHGLEPSVLASFPVFPYSSIKGLRKSKCGLVCAICLSEFSDDDEVRLLTVCNHAFHPDCIDLWLSSHVTCPVCRSDLEKLPAVTVADSHCIVVKDGEGEASGVEERPRMSPSSSGSSASDGRRDRVVPEEEIEDDEYTLRLPEDTEARMVYIRTGSGSHRGSRNSATTGGINAPVAAGQSVT